MVEAAAPATNPPTGTARYAKRPAANKNARMNNLAATSLPTRDEATAKSALIGAQLGTPIGKSNRLGPGQSVPKRYPGANHGPASKTVSKPAQSKGSTSSELTLSKATM